MKKTKVIVTFLIIFSITLAMTPQAIPQIGTYTFHGAAGNEKILKVRTVNNASLEDLFGAGWVSVIENFGPGAANVGARYKSLVNDVNFTGKLDTSLYFLALGLLDVVIYNTSNWGWTTEAFNNTPDTIGVIVESFYDPSNFTTFINTFYAVWFAMNTNVSMHSAPPYLTQLPTSVAQYLGALVWEPKWEGVGNTIVHNAEAGDWELFASFQYLEDCTEIWTYDTTYGAFIGYKIQDNETNTIYEFSIELPGSAEISGYELPIVIGVFSLGIISLIYIVMKQRRK